MDKRITLEELAGKYPLLRKVIDGGTTLEETLDLYEKELYSDFNAERWWSHYFGEEESDSDFSNYDAKLEEFIRIIEEAGGRKLELSQPIAPGYTAIPCALGYAYAMRRMACDSRGDYDSKEDCLQGEKYIRRTMGFFIHLRTKAQEIDSTICQIYIVRYFLEKPEHFKKVYRKMGEGEKSEVQKKLVTLLELGALDMSVIELERFLRDIKSGSETDG